MGKERLWNRPIRSCLRTATTNGVGLTVSGEAFAVESDDLGLAMMSAIGGRLMVNVTEATRSENSTLPSVGKLESRLSSYDPSKRSSSTTRAHDWRRFSFRREVAPFKN